MLFRTKKFDRRKMTYARAHRAMITAEFESEKFEMGLLRYSLSSKGFNFSFFNYRNSELEKWLKFLKNNNHHVKIHFKTYGPTPPHGCCDDHDDPGPHIMEFSCKYLIRRLSFSSTEYSESEGVDLARVNGWPKHS